MYLCRSAFAQSVSYRGTSGNVVTSTFRNAAEFLPEATVVAIAGKVWQRITVGVIDEMTIVTPAS